MNNTADNTTATATTDTAPFRVTVFADGSEYLMTQAVYWYATDGVSVRGTAGQYSPLTAAMRLVAARFPDLSQARQAKLSALVASPKGCYCTRV